MKEVGRQPRDVLVHKFPLTTGFFAELWLPPRLEAEDAQRLIEFISALPFDQEEDECVCGETSTRNCPVHASDQAEARWEAQAIEDWQEEKHARQGEE